MTIETVPFESKESELKKYIKPSLINTIPHYLPLGIFPLIFLAAINGGWWLLPAFIYMSVSDFFDKLLGVDGKVLDPYNTTEQGLFWHNLPVWIWAFLWPVTLLFCMWQILVAGHLSVWESIAMAIILTMEAQAVFVIGHEMIHRRVKWERRVGEFLLASASYPTYATEHVYIHHAKVGTPYDVGSAPKGESFWSYLPKELVSNITNSWALDKDRLARRGLPAWHYSNPFWRYGFGLLFWYGAAYLMGGTWAIPIFIFLGFGCVFSMKLSNYLQHYGLRRVLLPTGRWEKVAPRHSWSADFKFSNWMFFNMQRHADHHATASRHYPLLQVRGPEESPELPGTYGDMMKILLRPKKWFEKMDPLVEQWREYFYPDMDDWSAYDSPVAMTRPDDFPAIVEIFDASPRLAKWIESHPKLLDSLKAKEFIDLDLPKGFDADPEVDSLIRKGLARVYWTYEMDVQEIKERIGEWPAADADETAQIVQDWTNDKAFQIGMHVVRGNLTSVEASKAYSNLAEASVSSIFEAVVADFEERMGALPFSIAAIVLNDLATRQIQLGSDLELVLIYDDMDNDKSTRLDQRFREALNILTAESLIFEPVRNNSNSISSLQLSELENFGTRNTDQAISILTKSRCIYRNGTTDMAKIFDRERGKLRDAYNIEHPPLDNSSTSQNTETDVSINKTLKDVVKKVDQIARYFQLSSTNEELHKEALTAENVLAMVGKEKMAQVASNLREIQGAVSLAGGENIESCSKSVKSLVAKTCGHEDFADLKTIVEEQAATTVDQINSITQ